MSGKEWDCSYSDQLKDVWREGGQRLGHKELLNSMYEGLFDGLLVVRNLIGRVPEMSCQSFV